MSIKTVGQTSFNYRNPGLGGDINIGDLPSTTPTQNQWYAIDLSSFITATSAKIVTFTVSVAADTNTALLQFRAQNATNTSDGSIIGTAIRFKQFNVPLINGGKTIEYRVTSSSITITSFGLTVVGWWE